MTIEKAIGYAKDRDYKNFMNCARKINPYQYKELIIRLNNVKGFWEDMGEAMSTDELREFDLLGSSDRMRDYLLEKSKKKSYPKRICASYVHAIFN